jgi:hypothetical protein
MRGSERFDDVACPLPGFEASAAARNAAEPGAGALARPASRLFDVVIVVAGQGPAEQSPNCVGPIVYCLAMRSVAGRGLNLPEYVTAINLTVLLYRLCVANTLVDCG